MASQKFSEKQHLQKQGLVSAQHPEGTLHHPNPLLELVLSWVTIHHHLVGSGGWAKDCSSYRPGPEPIPHLENPQELAGKCGGYNFTY